MRGTSSTSFAEVLRQAEAAFAAETGSLETVAEELFSVADAIDSSNQLVRLLSDAGRRSEERRVGKECECRRVVEDKTKSRTQRRGGGGEGAKSGESRESGEAGTW